MPIDPAKLLAHSFEPIRQRYARRDTQLYALGVGAGQDDPCSAANLRLTYEAQLKALPTFAVTLCDPGFWVADPALGIHWQHMLHIQQRLSIMGPLPVEGELLGQEKVERIYDRGADKGAVLVVSRTLSDPATGAPLAISEMTGLLRVDGGFDPSGNSETRLPRVPEREADLRVAAITRPEQALLYRLSGDHNPLHADPAVAAAAGFKRPILHGLCTFGIACRVLIESLAAGEPGLLREMAARFSAPVYPGESLLIEIWRQDQGRVAFRCSVPQRRVMVLDNGQALFSATAPGTWQSA